MENKEERERDVRAAKKKWLTSIPILHTHAHRVDIAPDYLNFCIKKKGKSLKLQKRIRATQHILDKESTARFSKARCFVLRVLAFMRNLLHGF